MCGVIPPNDVCDLGDVCDVCVVSDVSPMIGLRDVCGVCDVIALGVWGDDMQVCDVSSGYNPERNPPNPSNSRDILSLSVGYKVPL